MDYEFSSLDELYKRVGPALRAKEVELRRLGYSEIKDVDIWEFLIQEKWRKGKNLMLYDIVSDIMHADVEEIDTYCRMKVSRTKSIQDFDNDIEMLEVR